MEYQAIWKIEVSAGGPVGAALEALSAQRDRASIATVFEIEGDGRTTVVDLGSAFGEALDAALRATDTVAELRAAGVEPRWWAEVSDTGSRVDHIHLKGVSVRMPGEAASRTELYTFSAAGEVFEDERINDARHRRLAVQLMRDVRLLPVGADLPFNRVEKRTPALSDLIKVAQAIVDSADSTGCSEDLTVCNDSAIERARDLVGAFDRLDVSLLMIAEPVMAVWQCRDDTGCTDDLTVTSGTAVERLAQAIELVGRVRHGVIEMPVDWPGVSMVIAVSDLDPLGGGAPSYAEVGIDKAVLNQIARMQRACVDLGASEIRQFHGVNWARNPRTEADEMIVTRDDVQFTAVRRHADIGFITERISIAELVTRALAAEPGSVLFHGNDIKEVFEGTSDSEDEDGDNEDEDGYEEDGYESEDLPAPGM